MYEYLYVPTNQHSRLTKSFRKNMAEMKILNGVLPYFRVPLHTLLLRYHLNIYSCFFSKGFHFGVVKLEVKSRTSTGVAFTTGGVSNHETGKVGPCFLYLQPLYFLIIFKKLCASGKTHAYYKCE